MPETSSGCGIRRWTSDTGRRSSPPSTRWRASATPSPRRLPPPPAGRRELVRRRDRETLCPDLSERENRGLSRKTAPGLVLPFVSRSAGTSRGSDLSRGQVAGSDRLGDVERLVAVADAVDSSFINDYQSVDIRLEKFMEHDEKFGIGGNDEYKNVTFGLFAAEDISAADGTVIPENSLISMVTLGEDMTAHFEEKLPFSRYYVQEIATDESYMLNDEKYLVNFEYMGQEQTTVDIDCGTFVNNLKRGSVSGKKVNEKNEPLEKAVFGLFKSNTTEFTAENALLTTESDKDGMFSFSDIPYGKYIVKEIAAPTGYILSEKQYEVNISEDGDSVEITAENVPITINKTSPPPTGDAGRSPLGLVMIIVGLCGVFYVSYKYRKMTKEKDTRSDEYSDLCPDFVEGAENE